MFYLHPADRAVQGAALDPWLRSTTLDSLRELEFVDYEQPPPASIFRSSPTLSFLSIEGCPLQDATAQGLHFPQLKQLGLGVSGGKNLWRQKYRNLIKCFHICLKTIVLEHYRGIMSQVNFATFFLLNAKVLESMTIQVRAEKYSPGFVVQQQMKLQLENRASRRARLHFTTARCLRDVLGINHVRDLDLADPFAYTGFVSLENL
ncbi:hypothetical protein ACQ4PT_026566 [Festuca glaucescens]